MNIFPHNAENAMKRADEFLELGKHNEAIGCLCEMFKAKKNKLLKNIDEDVINKLLKICVDCQISQPAKDCLYTYRMLCQNVNLKSLEDVVKHFLALAEDRLSAVKTNCNKGCASHVSLDGIETPESLLRFVCSENDEDRRNRVVVLPSVKFMWECYRFCLELLRNSQMDKTYHFVARSALNFCVDFSRKNELRKVFYQLKSHLEHLHKKQTLLSNDFNYDIQTLYIETGMLALDSAVHLELWQEVFKAIEYLHLVICTMKKYLPSKIIGTYYEKLSIVFMQTGDLLYHAAALLRYFLLSRDLKKNFSANDLSLMSSRVVLAVLSVPFPPSNLCIDLIAESDQSVIEKKHKLLSTVLDLPSNPTRKTLISDLLKHSIIECSFDEVKNLFRLLEIDVDPLHINSKLLNNTDSLHKRKFPLLNQYFTFLYDNSIIRILTQISQIYKTITFGKLMTLVPSEDVLYIEKYTVEAARKYNLPLTIDHVNDCLIFSSGLSIFQEENDIDGPEKNYLPVGKHLHYLTKIQSSLKELTKYISPNDMKLRNDIIRNELVEEYEIEGSAHRQEMLGRRFKIKKYKDLVEKKRTQKVEEEKKMIAEKQLKLVEQEKQRLGKEAKERAIQQHLRQQEEMKKQILLEKVETLKKSDLGIAMDKIDFNTLEDLDPETVLSKHFENINKEKKELVSRLRRQERALDHMERAKRQTEISLLKAEEVENKLISRKLWDENEDLKVRVTIEERNRLVKCKDRYKTIKGDLHTFLEKVSGKGRSEIEKELIDFNELLAVEKEKRLRGRALERKKQRKLIWLEEQKRKIQHRKELEKLKLSFNSKESRQKMEKVSQNDMSPLHEFSKPFNIVKIEKRPSHKMIAHPEICVDVQNKEPPPMKKQRSEDSQDSRPPRNLSQDKPPQKCTILQRPARSPSEATQLPWRKGKSPEAAERSLREGRLDESETQLPWRKKNNKPPSSESSLSWRKRRMSPSRESEERRDGRSSSTLEKSRERKERKLSSLESQLPWRRDTENKGNDGMGPNRAEIGDVQR